MPIRTATTLHLPEVTYEISHDFLAPGEEGRCDFCSSQPVVICYPCPNFTTRGILPSGKPVEWVSVGHWGACHACMQLIEAGKLRALLRRSLRYIQGGIPKPHQESHAEIVERHQHQFFERRGLGEPSSRRG